MMDDCMSVLEEIVIRVIENIKSKKEEVSHSCWICMDKGFVQYPLVEGKQVYEMIAGCICEEGDEYKKCRSIDDVADERRLQMIEANNKELLKPLESCEYKSFPKIMREIEEYCISSESMVSSAGG